MFSFEIVSENQSIEIISMKLGTNIGKTLSDIMQRKKTTT